MSAGVLREAAAGMREDAPSLDDDSAWHPDVALAVADLLDSEANAFIAHMERQADPERRFASVWLAAASRRHELSLAVARAYLGESP